MPLVTVYYAQCLSPGILENLVNALPGLVAGGLSCDEPEGKLDASMVEVIPHPCSKESVLNGYDVMVVVDANDYPSRRESLQERNNQMASLLQIVMPKGTKAFLWTRLMPAAFTEMYEPADDSSPLTNQGGQG